MKTTFYILLLVAAYGCSSTNNVDRLTEAVFDLSMRNQVATVNPDSIQTVHELNELYCKKAQGDPTFRLIVPYDFHTYQLQKNASTGIAVMGPPTKCWMAKSESYTFRFELEDQRWLANDEVLDFAHMDSLVALNIFNNGQDPSLSENPKKAVFNISAKGDTSIKSLTQILGALTMSYIHLLNQKSKEYESVDSLVEDYPLHIIIAENTIPPPIDTALREEIEGQIEIDLD